MVQLTLDFYRRNYIEGLFLSSGIIRSPDYTMEQIVEVARLLREVHGFRGYIHLKTIPDARPSCSPRPAATPTGSAINIELPTRREPARAGAGEGRRRHPPLDGAAARCGSTRRQAKRTSAAPRAPRFAPAGQSTQMIVGADAADDRDDPGDDAPTSTAATGCGGSTTRPFSPIPDASAALPLGARRRWCASTGCTRPTG